MLSKILKLTVGSCDLSQAEKKNLSLKAEQIKKDSLKTVLVEKSFHFLSCSAGNKRCVFLILR